MSTIISIILFIFFIFVFLMVLMGGMIVRTIKNFRKNLQHAAEQQDFQHRTQTGRQRQQYSHRQQTTTQRQQKATHTQQTTAASGETIIDNRRNEREKRKIFDETDGEYVEFTEE